MRIFKKNRQLSGVTYTDGDDRICDGACKVDSRAERNKVWALSQGSMPVIR